MLYVFRPKRKNDSKLFYWLFLIIGGIFALGLLVFGALVISETILKEEKQIESQEKVAPKKVEVKVENVQKRRALQKNTRQTAKVKQIKVVAASSLNAGNLDFAVPNVEGVGGGISLDGAGSFAGQKMVASPTIVNLFGIKGKTERILICVDTSATLMSDKKGGFDTYKVIKKEINNLINRLSSTTLFNLMVFDVEPNARILYFSDSLISATQSNKKEAIKWLASYNTDLKNIGLANSVQRFKDFKYPFLPQPPSSGGYWRYKSSYYAIYQSAIEQGVDTIYILTTSWSNPDEIMRESSDSDKQRYLRELERFVRDTKAELKKAGFTDEKFREYRKAQALKYFANRKKAIKWLENENARRQKQGISLKIVKNVGQVIDELKLSDIPDAAKYGKLPNIGKNRPKMKFTPYGKIGIERYYEPFLSKIYDDNKLPRPKINIILFRGKDEGDMKKEEEQNIRNFARSSGGRFIILKGLGSVESGK